MTKSSAHWLRNVQEKGNRGLGVALMLSMILGFAGATPGSVIIGYIVDENGDPVAEASVKAVHVSAGPPWSSVTSTSPQIIAATRSDAEGYFELLVPRAVRSRVNCLFYDHSGKSGAVQSFSYAKSMRLILRQRKST